MLNYSFIYFFITLIIVAAIYYFLGTGTEAIILIASNIFNFIIVNKGVKDANNVSQTKSVKRKLFRY